jgi:hypothetical protein
VSKETGDMKMSNVNEKIEGIKAQAQSEAQSVVVDNIFHYLSAEEVAALESKAAILAPEVQSAMREAAPGLSIAAQYMLRQAKREAEAQISRKYRDEWIMQLVLFVPTLNSSSEAVKKNAEQAVSRIAEEISTAKMAVAVLQSVKQKLLNKTSHFTEIEANMRIACKIFNVNLEALNK